MNTRTSLLTVPESRPRLRPWRSLLAALAAPLGALAFTSGSVQAAPPPMGVNLTGDLLYADAMRTGRASWDSPTHFGDNSVAQDANGWPLADASNIVWEGRDKNEGVYSLQFNGQATLGASFGYATFANQSYNSATNTTTASMTVKTGSQNFSLIFTNTKRTSTSATNTGVTNVVLMRPTTLGGATSYPVGTLYTTPVGNIVTKFDVVRFMDLLGANNSTQTNWSDRVLPTARRGFSYEHAIRLCNQFGCDAYINLPARATDDFLTKVAQLFRYGSNGTTPYTSTQASPVYPPLNPGLHVYLEWSNEVWNGSFQQFHDNLSAVQADIAAKNAEYAILDYDGLDTTGPDSNGNYNNQYTLAWRRIAKRLVDVSNFWRSVWGDASMMTAIRPVLEYQYANGQDTARTELTFLNGYYNNGDGKTHVASPAPPAYYLYGAGGATYYGSNNDNASTVDALFASGIPSTGYTNTMAGEAIWARAYNLKVVAYEGGWSTEQSGGNGYSNPTGSPACEAKYDIRAKQAEIDAQNIFNQNGGDLNIFYASSGSHTWIWGMTDDVYNLTEPLYQAIDTLNASNQAVQTAGTAIPASNITATSSWFSGGSVLMAMINTSTGGNFTLSNISARDAQTFRVKIDGFQIGDATFPAGGGNPGFTVALEPGIHVISFQNLSGGTFFYSYSISAAVTTAPIQYETEEMPVVASSGKGHRLLFASALSKGQGTTLDATTTGDYVSYLLPNVAARSYAIAVGIKKNSARGIVQAAIGRADNFSGTASNVGAAIDAYSATDQYVEVSLGSWTPGSTSDKWIRFQTTGKNASSTGYTIGLDYVKLTPQ